jgi:hypothetical protein
VQKGPVELPVLRVTACEVEYVNSSPSNITGQCAQRI